jgi:Protein of unknown function (DUF4080)/B12 binding domain/Radical SAM superfamily
VPSFDIVLCTLNAKYIHAAFGLRCLYANLGTLQASATLLELDIQQRPVDVVEKILTLKPKIVGLSVYIWNVALMREVVSILKRAAPEVKVVLGGPEVSHELDAQPWTLPADCVIQGEGELAFASQCRAWMRGATDWPRVQKSSPPPLPVLASPYPFYTDDDIRHRIIYVEASRGCPYSCEFCLSSLDDKVRAFELDAFLDDLRLLLHRGVTTFKFVDRTFNLNIKTSTRILEFFLEHDRPGLFVHFEMIPDRFPESLRDVVKRFRPGVLQFEVGVQTLTPAVEQAISRRQDHTRMAENFAFLKEAQVHVHADLIVGLPFETVADFAGGFNRLHAFGPEEIQVGILKRLRGAPIDRHTASARMSYSAEPPYEILSTSTIDFFAMQQLKRFARHWDVFVNSGNFSRSAPLLWKGESSVFDAFFAFSQFLHQHLKTTANVSLLRNMEALHFYLTQKHDRNAVNELMLQDYRHGGRHETPGFLNVAGETAVPQASGQHNKRQQRHQRA